MEAIKIRQAQVLAGEKGQNRTVRISHPGKLSPDEIAHIDMVLVNNVRKDLTGCAYLSGTIDVFCECNIANVLDLRLGRRQGGRRGRRALPRCRRGLRRFVESTFPRLGAPWRPLERACSVNAPSRNVTSVWSRRRR